MFPKKLVLSTLMLVAVLAYGVYAAGSGSGSSSSGSNGSSGSSTSGSTGGTGTSGTTGSTSNTGNTEMDNMGTTGTTGSATDTGMGQPTGVGSGTGTEDLLNSTPDTNRNKFGNDTTGAEMTGAAGTKGLDALRNAGFNQRDQVSAILQSRKDALNADLKTLDSQPQNDDTRRQIEMKQRQLQALDSNMQRVGQADEQKWNDVRDSVLNDDSMR